MVPEALLDALREKNQELVDKVAHIESILLWCIELVDSERYEELKTTLEDLYEYGSDGETI